MDKRHVIQLQGQEFVTYEGLLHEAHQRGLKAIRTEIVQLPDASNGQTAVVRATVELEGDRFFSGIGDANPTNVNQAIARHLIRMAECVPLSAEILTRDGFKRYDRVNPGDEVLAYDVEQDQCVWTPLEAVTVYEEPVPTLKLSSRSFHAICTPDHTWAVTRTGKRVHANPRTLRKAFELNTSDHIVVAAPAEGGNHPLTPQEAALIGWLATDGYVSKNLVRQGGKVYGPYKRAAIAQSKPAYLEELRELVLAGGGSVTTSFPKQRDFGTHVSECLPAHKFNLSAGATRNLLENAELNTWLDLPGLVLKLSKPARAAMLDAMLKGDGSCRRDHAWVFGQKAKPGVMEAFELLATLEGSALGKPRLASRGEVPVRQVRRNRVANANYLKVERDQDQPVWCPTTRFGTWVMRQDGFITITGNTRSKARALRDAVDVGMTSFEELGDAEARPEDAAVLAATPPRTATPKQIAKVAAEMIRVGWSDKKGRDYLIRRYHKLSRSELTAAEISQLIDHLVGLPPRNAAM